MDLPSKLSNLNILLLFSYSGNYSSYVYPSVPTTKKARKLLNAVTISLIGFSLRIKNSELCYTYGERSFRKLSPITNPLINPHYDWYDYP